MKYCEKYQLAGGKMEIIISLLKRQNQEQQKKNLRHDWGRKMVQSGDFDNY